MYTGGYLDDFKIPNGNISTIYSRILVRMVLLDLALLSFIYYIPFLYFIFYNYCNRAYSYKITKYKGLRVLYIRFASTV